MYGPLFCVYNMQNMAFIEWDESCSVGVHVIDKQHQRLFQLINDFHDATTNLDAMIHDLFAYIDFHFTTEEKYFEDFEYKDTEHHKKEHQFYRDRIRELYQQSLERKKNEQEIGEELETFIKDWIVHHIKISDKKYTECFREHGLV